MITITYAVNVTVSRVAVPGDIEETPESVATWMQTPEAKRELEREVIRALRGIDGECDAEVMEVERKQ